MLTVKIIRSLFAMFLTCVIALSSFGSPAFASSDLNDFDPIFVIPDFASPTLDSSSYDSFKKGFWETFGGIVGGAAGTVVTCYAVNVIIAPFAPPVAGVLGSMCPAIGSAIGGLGGAAAANTVIAHP